MAFIISAGAGLLETRQKAVLSKEFGEKCNFDLKSTAERSEYPFSGPKTRTSETPSTLSEFQCQIFELSGQFFDHHHYFGF